MGPLGAASAVRTPLTPLFAQQFLIAFSDLTARLTGSWRAPSCVAQELELRILLNRVEVIADNADVALPEGWRSRLEDLLFDDLDHENLLDPDQDGFEESSTAGDLGMASMRFRDWFRTFRDNQLSPYCQG